METEFKTLEQYKPQFTESFEEVCTNLKSLSDRLFNLLPDKTLSPDERLERIARIIPTSILCGDYHKTGRTKLNKLRYRLDELVPDNNLDYNQKLEFLVDLVNETVPGDMLLYQKLELIGDKRKSDIGR
ncbi:hypothetical protein [Brevibacillus daliensis]|uniref:hypothetical protein n=1 Tax=Brevibacillus daliensis TaxID=2892995 RepID=UPI001E62CDC2|nr:hypothetical protein [Brevibacillus daliensis]